MVKILFLIVPLFSFMSFHLFALESRILVVPGYANISIPSSDNPYSQGDNVTFKGLNYALIADFAEPLNGNVAFTFGGGFAYSPLYQTNSMGSPPFTYSAKGLISLLLEIGAEFTFGSSLMLQGYFGYDYMLKGNYSVDNTALSARQQAGALYSFNTSNIGLRIMGKVQDRIALGGGLKLQNIGRFQFQSTYRSSALSGWEMQFIFRFVITEK